jgi:alpha-1,2-mannosyltransferase
MLQPPVRRPFVLLPSRTALLALLGLLFFFSYGYFTVRKNLRPECVFSVFYDAGAAVREGRDIDGFRTEAGLGYIYPPLLALLFSPLVGLGRVGAAWAWYSVNFVLLGLSFFMALRIPTVKGEKPGITYFLFPLLATCVFWSHNFEYGQASLFLVFPTLLALLFYDRRLDLPAGLALGFAASIKLFPSIFVLYFLVKKEWRVIAYFFLGAALFFFGVPALFFGPREAAALLGRWVHIAFSFQARAIGLQWTTPLDQSLSAALDRILFFFRPGEPAASPHLPALKTALYGVIAGGLLVLISWLCRRKHAGRLGIPGAVEFSLFFLAIPFVSGTGWKHHFVVLIPPYATAACLLLRKIVKVHEIPGVLIGIAFLLHVSLSPVLSGGRGSEWLQIHSAALLGTLLLIVAFAVVHRRLVRRGSLDSAETPQFSRPPDASESAVQ